MSDSSLTARMVGSILHPDSSTVGTINDAGPVADTISQIKELSGTLLEDRESSLSDLDMEHPPTPDSRPLICMDQEENEQGYDSDRQIGPFFDTIYDGVPLHVGYKEEVGIGEPEQAINILPPAADLTHNYSNKMKLVNLKE